MDRRSKKKYQIIFFKRSNTPRIDFDDRARTEFFLSFTTIVWIHEIFYSDTFIETKILTKPTLKLGLAKSRFIFTRILWSRIINKFRMVLKKEHLILFYSFYTKALEDIRDRHPAYEKNIALHLTLST